VRRNQERGAHASVEIFIGGKVSGVRVLSERNIQTGRLPGQDKDRDLRCEGEGGSVRTSEPTTISEGVL